MSYNRDALDTTLPYILQYDGHPEARMAQDAEMSYSNEPHNFRAEPAKQLLVS